jgi:two-component system NtrC family sensor kinase
MIRRRLIGLNIAVFIFICLLITTYSLQFVFLGNYLFILEDFHNLSDNVLMARNLEKDVLPGADSGSISSISIMEYLGKIEAGITRQEENIVSAVGRRELLEFQAAMDGYRTIFASYSNTSSKTIDAQTVREKGKVIEDFARRLLDIQKQKIRSRSQVMHFTFLSITGALFLFIITGLYLQAKSVLGRIAFVQQAAKRGVDGNFQPITDDVVHPDEISDLIRVFNMMASELETRQEQLIQAGKLAALGTFSSSIAHELNNPLNNISLSADTLLEELPSLDQKEAKEIITDIITQTERATAVVKNLLDFSRAKTPSTERLEIKDVLAKTEKLIANELRLNGIRVEDHVPLNLPPVMGDMQELQQVFLNLLVNSIQAMPAGGTITLEAGEESSGYIRIEVSDTGPGIAPGNIDHIFDPFYTTKEVGKGTGLGLSIVNGIVKKHGGYIEVKSKLKAGTTFSIFLPLAGCQKTTVRAIDASRGPR